MPNDLHGAACVQTTAQAEAQLSTTIADPYRKGRARASVELRSRLYGLGDLLRDPKGWLKRRENSAVRISRKRCPRRDWDELLLCRAEIELNNIRLRESLGNFGLFREFPWHVMVAVYVHERKGAAIKTSDLVDSYACPENTIVDLLDKLREQKLLTETGGLLPGRETRLRLTERGVRTVHCYLIDMQCPLDQCKK